MPTVPQYFNITYPPIYYPYSSEASLSKPVTSNTSLELPPGGILLTDEYIDDHDIHRAKDRPRKNHKRFRRLNKPVERSTMSNLNNTHLISSSELNETLPKVPNRQFVDYPNNTTSSRSLHNLSTNATTKPVTLPSNSDTLRDIRLSLASRDNQLNRSPIVPSISTKVEEKTNSSIYPLSSIQSDLKTISIAESDITKQSLSTFRPHSRSTFRTTRDTNTDSISLASTFKSNKDHFSTTDTF